MVETAGLGRPKAIEVNGPYLAMMMSAGILSGGVPPANIYYAAGTAASTANLSDGSAIRPYQLFQFFVDLGEGVNGEFQVFAGMGCGDLRADTRGAMWNNRVKEADHVNSFLQHARGELL